MPDDEPDDVDESTWAGLLGPDEETAGVWLRTDEIGEMIGALEHTAELAETVGSDVNRWKWLIIALHNALQGACVCALRGRDTAGISVLTEKSAKRVWQWLNVDSRLEPRPPMPRERLAEMVELFKRVQDVSHLQAEHLPANAAIEADVVRLNSLRNDFIHFVPKGLSLEMSGMPRIVRHCCDVIEHLAVKRTTFWHHLDERRSARIKAALSTLRAAMDAWEGTPR